MLTVLGAISLFLIVLVGLYLYFTDEFSIANMAIAIIAVPIGLVILILANRSEGKIQSYMAQDRKPSSSERMGDKNDT